MTDRPGPQSRYDPHVGYRVNVHTLAATCVHPYRVGVAPAAYASARAPLPEVAPPTPAPLPIHLELPADVVDLEGWFVATLRACPPEGMASALARAEATAAARFTARDVVAAMRRVLSVELTRRA
ncbi:hypothetical protein AB0K00_54170 [Dactylosporangium sp. NPDC049525]|uniref:hypothetical protein n=1 Tax=Dactylosporangium sp. NPDC049525 TaxID=3154730 RepID=UPI00342F82F7